MNIQTEHLENHTARFTVEIEPGRLEKAKQATVRKLSQRVNIPGFRKGKAPYNIMVRYLGEAAILEETVEQLGQEIYRETLDQVDIEPYGPGQLEDFRIEPNPTFIYTVPKQPTVILNDYRAVRLDYDEPVITDADVNRQINLLLEEEALVEESRRPAQIGDRVTIDIHSYFLGEGKKDNDEDADDAAKEASTADTTSEADTALTDEADDAEGEDHHHHSHTHQDDEEEGYIHQHDLPVRLTQGGDEEPIGPGFSAALVGANVGDERIFEIAYPTGDKISDEVAGRRVRFYVNVKKIETMTLPVLNDEFAARFTDRFAPPQADEASEDEETEQPSLSLLELRMRIRELLQESANRATLDTYANKVLDEVVRIADVSYPDAMIEDQLDDIMKNVDSRLKSQGLSLEMFQRITGRTVESLRDDYRDEAIKNLERSLVLAELFRTEKMQVTREELQDEVVRIAMQFGPEQASAVMHSLTTPQMLNSIMNRLMQENVYERLASIGRGQAPELPADNTEETTAEATMPEPADSGEAVPAETQEKEG